MALARWGHIRTDQHLTILRTIIPAGSDDTESISLNSDTTEKFVSHRFCLCRAISTALGPLRKVLHAAPWESKSSLHSRHELASPAARLPQYIMCPRGADDLCAIRRCTNTNPCVTVLSQTPHTTQEHPSD